MQNRVIFHVDVNSAFLSWEAVRRVSRGEPDLRLVPSAVGGDPSRRTSIISAKSIPAKKYGITTGEPVSMALRKCPQLIVVPGDFRLYRQCSNAFMTICREFTPVVQQFSIDECFLDMSGMEKIWPDPVAAAYSLKDRIKTELGFTVNVGVAHNKLLAKMASDFKKPDRVHTLWEDEIPEKLWPLPVGELFMIGKRSAEKLERNYVRTIGDLAQRDLASLQALLGQQGGTYAYRASHGMDDSPVEEDREDEKSYSHAITVEENITTAEEAKLVLLEIADHVSRRMRRDGARAYCIGVTIRDNQFKNMTHQRQTGIATDISGDIYRISCELFDEMWNRHTPLRLLSITLSDVTRDSVEQQSLMPEDNQKRETDRKVDSAVDAILEKYGRGAIGRASIKE